MKTPLLIILIIVAFGFTLPDKEWIAPESANNLANPLIGNTAATDAGKKLFVQFCVPCHGDKGRGDGIAGVALNPKPKNFTLDKIQMQTDGALYWKITEGRPPMASYKAILKDDQRWQLVNYIRTFKKK